MNESKNIAKESEIGKTKRIFYYDVLRALAIIGIVFCHVSASYVSRDMNSPNLYISVFFDCFRDFSIPLFVMLSGALLIGKKDSLQKFFYKRLTRLLIPFIFWAGISIIFSAHFITHGFDLDNSLKIIWGTAGTLGVHYWFVWMIITAYIGIFLLNKLLQSESIRKHKKQFMIILVMISLMYFGIVHYGKFNPYTTRLTYFPSFLTYIIMGYFLAKCDFLEGRIDKKYLISATAILFIGSYLWYILGFVSPRSHMAHQFVRLSYFNLLILFMSTNAFLLFKYLSKTETFKEMENNLLGRAFTLISNYSYGIYLIHYLVLYRLKANLIRFIDFNQGSSLIWIPLLVIVTTGISVIILEIFDRIPYLDRVTGKK